MLSVVTTYLLLLEGVHLHTEFAELMLSIMQVMHAVGASLPCSACI